MYWRPSLPVGWGGQGVTETWKSLTHMQLVHHRDFCAYSTGVECILSNPVEKQRGSPSSWHLGLSRSYACASVVRDLPRHAKLWVPSPMPQTVSPFILVLKNQRNASYWTEIVPCNYCFIYSHYQETLTLLTFFLLDKLVIIVGLFKDNMWICLNRIREEGNLVVL